MIEAIARGILGNRLNVLLLAVPASWLLHWIGWPAPWVFGIAAVSLIPLAGVIGRGTDDLARKSGPALGGLLNATFGNAAELIIGVVALREGHVQLVKASISGSIIGNLLLVLGASAFVGGLGRTSQKFARTAASNLSAMLFLAVIALVMPAVFDLSVYGSLDAHPQALDRLSIGSALVLIGSYVGSLIYSLTSRRDLFRPEPPDSDEAATMSMGPALVLLGLGTALTTVQAELLIGSLRPALQQFGLTELFVGVVVIAIIGNAAEHYSAIVAARRDHMTLAVEIAVGSSAQIALVVAPVLVLYSFTIGRPMTLLFNPLEITAIALSVLTAALVVSDGESNWVEGLQLLSVYAVIGLAFYFVP